MNKEKNTIKIVKFRLDNNVAHEGEGIVIDELYSFMTKRGLLEVKLLSNGVKEFCAGERILVDRKEILAEREETI